MLDRQKALKLLQESKYHIDEAIAQLFNADAAKRVQGVDLATRSLRDAREILGEVTE